MKIIIFMTVLLSIISGDIHAALYSKNLGKIQVENSDCYIIKIAVFTDMDTVDPRDDKFLFSYNTVVGRDCDGLFDGNLIGDPNQFSNSNLDSKVINNDEIILYPNPTNSVLRLGFSDSEFFDDKVQNLVSFYVIDANGQIMESSQCSLGRNRTIEIDTSHYKPGDYVIIINNGRKSISKQFIKI